MGKSFRLKCAHCEKASRVALQTRFKSSLWFRIPLWIVLLLPKLVFAFLVRCVAQEAVAFWRLFARETVAECPNCRQMTIKGS